MKRLLSRENVGGREERWWKHFDGNGNPVTTVETVQDAAPIIARNKRAFNDAPSRYGKGDFHKVADIPVTVIEATARLKEIPFKEFMQCRTDRAQRAWKELLNSRDMRAFRTRPGRVDVKR